MIVKYISNNCNKKNKSKSPSKAHRKQNKLNNLLLLVCKQIQNKKYIFIYARVLKINRREGNNKTYLK